MSLAKKIGIAIFIGVFVLVGVHFVERLSNSDIDIFVSTAEAEVGRPLTPVSIAGVARRTSRRVSRRR